MGAAGVSRPYHWSRALRRTFRRLRRRHPARLRPQQSRHYRRRTGGARPPWRLWDELAVAAEVTCDVHVSAYQQVLRVDALLELAAYSGVAKPARKAAQGEKVRASALITATKPAGMRERIAAGKSIGLNMIEGVENTPPSPISPPRRPNAACSPMLTPTVVVATRSRSGG